MIVERIIFNVIAFALFIIVFFKMIHKNDTNYTYILALQALGIAIGFIGLVFRVNLPLIINIFTYIISILLPLIIIIFEEKGITLSEIIYMNIAKFYCYKNDKQKAKEILIKMTEKYPNSYYLHKQLAEICEEMQNIDIAIDEYMRASDINKLDFDIQIKTANLLKSTQRKEESARILNEILKIKPDNYEASCLLGDILYEQENFKEAANIYLQALNYNPDKYELYYNLGMIFTRLNDFQSAKEYYEKAAQLNSLLYHAKYDLGQIALLYNELEEAEEYFTQCINDEDLADEVYYYLAYIAMLKGERETAIQYLNTAVEENKELYEKASKELVFKFIINRVKRPTNTTKNKKKKITIKELETIKHLEETCEVVGNLSQNDIKAIRTLKRKEKDRLEKEERE